MSLYLSKLVLKNVRGFQDAVLDFGTAKSPRMWNVIIGNNGAGKSTLLRAIAIGLCDEKTASALLLKLPGEFIRRNKKGMQENEAKIELTFSSEAKSQYKLRTTIKRDESGEIVVRKDWSDSPGPAWKEVFVCGYGVNRGTRGSATRDSYALLESLESLFDDRVSLLDPEAVLLALKLYSFEQEAKTKEQKRKVIRARKDPFSQAKDWLWKLWDMNPNHPLEVTSQYVKVHGPWGGGGMPFHALGDGYRGSAGVVLDLLGNAFKADRWGENPELRAIVLIDEVEEHLHPRWQKAIIPRMRKAFPNVQFIVTTHSPLTLVNLEEGEVIGTMLHNGIAEIDPNPKPSPEGKTANEILSEWFGVTSSLDDKSEKLLQDYAKAVQRGDTAEADKLREKARQRIHTFLSSPMDDLAIQIAHEAREQIDAATTPAERKLTLARLGAELRAKLKAGKSQ